MSKLETKNIKSSTIIRCLLLVCIVLAPIVIFYTIRENETTYCNDMPIFVLDNKAIDKYKQLLINSRILSTFHIYYEEYISEESLAFSMLCYSDMSLPAKQKFFYNIFQESKYISGKLYALIAMYSLDRRMYYKLKKKLNASDKVVFLCGDIEDSKCLVDYILKGIETKNLSIQIFVPSYSLKNMKTEVVNASDGPMMPIKQHIFLESYLPSYSKTQEGKVTEK